MKKVFALIFGSFFLYLTLHSVSYKDTYVEPDVDTLLQEKVTKDFLEKRVEDALFQERYQDAKSYLELANYLDIQLPKRLSLQLKEKDGIAYELKEFSKGFFKGKSNSEVSLYGSIASDFTVIGDLRDLKTEGEKYIHNKPYDEFLLGISALGVGLTFSTIATAGSSAPLKVGASVVKAGIKTKRITKGFSKFLLKRFSKSYDKRVFKRVSFDSPKSIKNAIKTIDITPLKSPLKNLSKIKKNTSLFDTLYLLKFIDGEKDLMRVTKLSKKYGKNTKAIFKILGKSVLRVTKKVFVFSKSFLTMLSLTLLSGFVLIKR